MMPGEVLYRFIQVPTLARRHCNMPAFRKHPKFGGLANSDLFPNILARIRRDVTQAGGYIRLDRLPPNVTVDCSGFLAVVTITA
jgi:hypothetical protein